ncbi:ubiquitin carboxyl-terminal hydrolase family protein [Aquimarina algicola]|uniref:UBP-type zinc finger domain-containing protein n=1 Tax=Aquimarina algicola TaxID=2589995 RepID=A0A504J265_9FLAO|nr:UBP-type zinc finger domain-containing protein [Aquimarina algicola]TPN81693.1 UBP-type zinc finger domain-containing protein [Aquimarina algicola]
MALKAKICEHLKNFDSSSIKKSSTHQCEECIKTGSTWVHLRTCQQCGVTLCCDSSPNKHASKHYQMHPDHNIIISAEPNENWAWCYEHKSFLKF